MSEALTRKSATEERQLQYVAGIGTAGMSSYEPADLKSAMDLCQVLCTNGLVPKPLENNPGGVLNVIAIGREMGMGWPSSLQNLYVVNGKISAYAEYQRAKIMKHPDCEMFEWVEISKTRAAAKVKKPMMDEPQVVEFTIDDAIQAKLAQRLSDGRVVGVVNKAGANPEDSNWSKYPTDMLVARVTSRVKSRYFPYVLTDIPTVEEMQDLPPEKNITPTTELADRRAEVIAEAAGKKATPPEPAPPPPAATEPEPQAEEPTEATGDETQEEPEDDGVQRIPDALRKRMIAEVDGVGPKVLLALEEEGLVTARHIWKRGTKGLSTVSGIGPSKAKALIDWASLIVDQEIRDEATQPEAAEAPSGEPEAQAKGGGDKPLVPLYRNQDYVAALMGLAEKNGVTNTQLRQKLDDLAIGAGLQAGLNPRSLPDPQWKLLEEWVGQGVQGTLLSPADEAAEPEPEKETEEQPAPAETISEKRVDVLHKTIDNIATIKELSEEELDKFESEFYLFLHEKWGVKKYEDIPVDGWGDVLAYLSENS